MLAIRLMPMGKQQSRSFRIVVTEKNNKRNGRYIEKLGSYSPNCNLGESKLQIRLERLFHWIGCGAKPTPIVNQLINKEKRNIKLSAAEVVVPNWETNRDLTVINASVNGSLTSKQKITEEKGFLYTNLWIEDRNKRVKQEPIELSTYELYYFFFSIETKDRTGKRQIFPEQEHIKDDAVSMDLEINCILLVDNENNQKGYLRETLSYYRNYGISPRAFELYCDRPDTYYLIVRLFFEGEPIFKQVLTIRVEDQ